MKNPYLSPQVSIVQASAGSGKTYALARRYIQGLLYNAHHKPIPFKHFLAITFTNKAASQMKERILDLLKKIALGQLSDAQVDDILAPVGLSQKEAAPIASRLMNELIEHYHFFGVQTIDSFMNTLLGGCAFKVDLSARFKIKRYPQDFLLLSLDEYLASSVDNKHARKAIDAFIHQYLFLENRSGWFPKKELAATLSVLFAQYNTYGKSFLKFNQGSNSLYETKKEFLEVATLILPLLGDQSDKRFKAGLEKFVQEHETGFDIDAVSRYFARADVPLLRREVPSRELAQLWERARKLLELICLQEAFGVFNPYIDVFDSVMAYFNRIQFKEDVLFLQQLNAKAGQLIQNGITVGELYFRLATRYEHYMFDEFQDTSYAQWANVVPMVDEALASGGSLFYVGDKKQAIYGFRGGQSRLFDDLKSQYALLSPQEEYLTKNWRSCKAIVDFNNHFFSTTQLSALMTQWQTQDSLVDKDIVFNQDDLKHLENVFGHAAQESLEGAESGYVSLRIVPGQKKEEREEIVREHVLSSINELKERFELHDIAILTRSNAQVELVSAWLLEAGIAAQSERTSDIKNCRLINELVDLLRFIHTPVDNQAFAQIMLGDIVPALTAMNRKVFEDFLFEWRQSSSAKAVPAYQYFISCYPELWEKLFLDLLKNAGSYPLYELMVSIIGRFKISEFFPQSQGFLMHFLELVKRHEEDGCDLDSFLEYYETLQDEDRYILMPAVNALSVLTVHKSKGLEFGVVIIPFLEMSIKVGSAADGAQSFISEPSDDGIRLVRLKEKYGLYSRLLKDKYSKEYKESFFEELNNVYVALTRARVELYIYLPERSFRGNNPAFVLFGQGPFEWGKKCAPKQKTIERIERANFFTSLAYEDWIEHLQEEFLSESPRVSKARYKGEAIHAILARIKRMTKDNAQEAIGRAIDEVIASGEFGDCRHYANEITRQLSRREFMEVFDLPLNANVSTEVAVVTVNGQTRRIDRLIVLDNEIWVVDFKTSPEKEESHMQQVREYAALVSGLYPGYQVSTRLVYWVTHD